ncbi:DUF1328 domain-containing protein, partial [Staphylococcus aureus]|uniref:DUF1328 domain-containing protein n=1 Tax=Staphylococcus aureus TaxID=1280 RepID=UPI0039BDA90F
MPHAKPRHIHIHAGRIAGLGCNLICLRDTSAACIPTTQGEYLQMLYWAAVFFVIAIIAGIFGFTGIAAGAVG